MEESFPDLRQCFQDSPRPNPGGGQGRGDLFVEMLKSLQLRQEDKRVSQAQHGKGGTNPQPKILTAPFRDRELPLFSNFCRRQVFDGSLGR